MSDGATWAVVATVDEPWPLVVAFAAYHLGLGAREVHLYFDRENPEAEARLSDLPNVHITTCDHAFWARHNGGARPVRTVFRQTHNANLAYKATEADWLLHCDADEFILPPKEGIGARLAAQPETVIGLRFLTAERVFLNAPGAGMFDGAFRTVAPGFSNWGEDRYGRFAKFFDKGLTGHEVGKSFTRTGQKDLAINIHFPLIKGTRDTPQMAKRDASLLHFDGLTPLHFRLKLLRRTLLHYYSFGDNPDGEKRIKQVRYLRNNMGDPARIDDLITALTTITEQTAAFLEGRGLLFRTPFDPAPMIARAGLTLDLTAAHFDDVLRGWAADLIADLEIEI